MNSKTIFNKILKESSLDDLSIIAEEIKRKGRFRNVSV